MLCSHTKGYLFQMVLWAIWWRCSRTIDSFTNHFQHILFFEKWKFIADNYIHFKSIVEVANPSVSADLAGKVFVITGKLTHFKNRDEIKARIEALGGKVTGSVSKNTNYLINNDVNSTSSKNMTAKSLGIPILSESDFIQTFGIE